MTPWLIIEIPHEMPASAWIAFNGEDDIISLANDMDNYGWATMTMQNLVDCYGDEDVPAEARRIVALHGSTVEVNAEFFTPDEAISEFDWACDAVFHDLNSHHVIHGPDEYAEFIESNTLTHQRGKALTELARCAEGLWNQED